MAWCGWVRGEPPIGAGGVVPPPCSFTPTQAPCHRQAPVTHTESHRDISAPTQAHQLPTVPQRPVVGGQHTGTMPTQPPAPPRAAGMGGQTHLSTTQPSARVGTHAVRAVLSLPRWHSCWQLLCSRALGGLTPQQGPAGLPPRTRCTCMHTRTHLHAHTTQLHTQRHTCTQTHTHSLSVPHTLPISPSPTLGLPACLVLCCLWGALPALTGPGSPSSVPTWICLSPDPSVNQTGPAPPAPAAPCPLPGPSPTRPPGSLGLVLHPDRPSHPKCLCSPTSARGLGCAEMADGEEKLGGTGGT